MYLRKLANSRREAPGLERVMLRKLPVILLGGTLIPLFFSVASRLYPPERAATQIAKHLKTMDILSIATVFTVAIGCFVVVLMKGPSYVADAYDLVDSERPRAD
jgi:amino acid permease